MTVDTVRLVRTGLLVFLASFVLGLGLGGNVSQAHDLGWRFLNIQPPGVALYLLLENRTSSYSSAIGSAAIDYHNNTDLNVDSCGYGCGGNVVYLQANYGATGWYALAYPFSGGVGCVDWYGNPSGYCNTTNHKVDFAYVYSNDAYGVFSDSQARYTMRHELGHVIGLAHTSCSVDSVMKELACLSVPTYLTGHDISDINAWY